MEANRKRRGLVKGKLMPLYRSTKTSSISSNMYISSKVKPSQAPPPATSVGFVVQAAHQDYLISPPKQKVSYIIPADNISNNNNNVNNKLIQFDKQFGIAGDEHVDTKAASYISAVQERFKLERSNSERKREDML